MKKLLLTFLIISSSLSSKSQFNIYHPLPAENAIWRETFNGSYTSSCSDYQYIITGDTIIDSLIYHKIQKSGVEYYVDQWGWCTGIIEYYFNYYEGAYRNDSVNKKVYFHKNSVDTLLYDFNLNVGDTLPTTYTNWGPDNYIETIDSILIGSNFHKRFGIASFYEPGYVYVHLIEGIGSTFGLLGIIQVPFEFGSGLLCFIQDGLTLYPDTNYICDLITDLGPELSNYFSIQINPNPFSKYAKISINGQIDNTEFRLYNIFGIEAYILQNISDGAIIDGSNFPVGVYIFKIIRNNTTLQMGKVVKL
jgi:hypothetical protein